MQKGIMELFSITIRLLVRYWTKENQTSQENLIDILDFAKSCGLGYIDANKFKVSLEEYANDMAEGFLHSIEEEGIDKERKKEIVYQIKKDIQSINLTEEGIVEQQKTADELCKDIMEKSMVERKLWDEKDKGVYMNCVRYIAKCIIDFSMKLPSFTPQTLKVIIQRQDEYHKDLQNIISEIQSVRNCVKSTELTYREFESTYRENVIERYSKVELIGSGITERSVKKYDISSAYVELNCIDEQDEEVNLSEVFSTNNIVWIRGEAGSGKTTFLRWVAICASKNSKEISNIHNKVPILISLREIKWPFELQECLNDFSKRIGHRCPDGWLDDVLKKNRSIILIDGLDEIEQENRQNVFDWIEDVERKYPKIFILITARSSVEDDLDCIVTHYEIAPMNISNIKKFIRYWHKSVLHIEAIEEDQKIHSLQENLTNKIMQSTPLKLLARNPLLCAMICALNYVNNEYLPVNKMDLYEKCCEMLIDQRDTQRKIQNSEYMDLLKLDYSRKRRILEELAYWMLRNGQSSEERENVELYFQKKILNSNVVQINLGKKQYSANILLNYLVERSGIIREPEKERIDFVHKTFMEFLAVKAICRDCDWGILADKACDVNWKETIIMCFHEMGKRQVSTLLKKLVDRGLKEKNDKYILLASLGATNAISIDEKVQKEIDLHIKKMIPPQRRNIIELSQAGTYILPFLVDQPYYTDRERENCLDVLTYMEIDEIIPDLLTYVEGEGDEYIKGYAIDVLTTFCEDVIEEYNVKERLLKIMLGSIKNGYLVLYEGLMNIISNIHLSRNAIEQLTNVKSIDVRCGLLNECIYYQCANVYNKFLNVKEVTLQGEIGNIDFIDEIPNIKVLSIVASEADEIVSRLSNIDTLGNVRKIVIVTEKLTYFCEQDISKMKNLEYIELSCSYPDLELRFEHLFNWPNLRKITLKINQYLFQEMADTISSWKKQNKKLQVVFEYLDE